MLSFFEFDTLPSKHDAYTVAETEMVRFFSDPERDISQELPKMLSFFEFDTLPSEKDAYTVVAETEMEAVAAALCSPRVKKTWQSLVPEHSHDLYISCLRSEVIKEVQRQEKAATPPSSNSQQSSQSQNSRSSSSQELSKMLSFFELNTVPSATDAYTVAETEMAKSFSDPERDICMLNRYKYMKPVFVRLNTSLPSSGPVERLFSIATFIDSPRSNRLTDENFDKRVLLKANLNEHVPRRKGTKVDNSF
ncbi:unnamed protein product [Bemisia tabaci]|uniref:HAT C-terminal dimerisation domain-containing protein n=1 Tax=Bemisia tabaci TaxID=7038 RepID=A0A9P0A0C5_BEMTA|nr:unnamed protein product [Bemisia tabaci]